MNLKHWNRLMAMAFILFWLCVSSACTETNSKSENQKGKTDQPVINDGKRY